MRAALGRRELTAGHFPNSHFRLLARARCTMLPARPSTHLSANLSFLLIVANKQPQLAPNEIDSPPTSTALPPAAPLSAARTVTLAGVSVKLPSFWPGDVELWFSLCEAEFDACGITRQETRFGRIAHTLPPEVAQEVRDLGRATRSTVKPNVCC